ncbi:MAG: phosphoribosylglycinamide formyltransferase [Phenylobacterium sp.]|uniref:phosphoribosylglycinamide formyltransferase n=1 Tax=Phenylobacterium sp. TaxID=1871053 RepID=UPI00391D2B5E
MTKEPLRIAFLASRNGSSFRAIVETIEAGSLPAAACLLVSNNRAAPALDFAQAHGVPTLVLPTKTDPEAADARLAEALAEAGADLVVLSGYLRRLGPATLSRFRNRILNIHPGPLPDFGGEGMYGRRVHEAVIAAGAAESAVVIHLVDEVYDNGPAIARRAIPLAAGETPESLEAKVTAAEPAFFVETLGRIARGELKLPG